MLGYQQRFPGQATDLDVRELPLRTVHCGHIGHATGTTFWPPRRGSGLTMVFAKLGARSRGGDLSAAGARRGGEVMTIELSVPNDWTPGQTLAMRTLLQQVLRTGHPIVTVVRPDATPDQIDDITGRVAALIREAGLAA